MKHIRNPDLYWVRLAELINAYAEARRRHKPCRDLQREATMVRAQIMDYENRRGMQ